MNLSRRDFVSVSLAGAAGLCVCGFPGSAQADAEAAPLPKEDGYKLWLRYAPPASAAAKKYAKLFKAIRVDGASPPCGIIKDELRAATNGGVKG